MIFEEKERIHEPAQGQLITFNMTPGLGIELNNVKLGAATPKEVTP